MERKGLKLVSKNPIWWLSLNTLLFGFLLGINFFLPSFWWGAAFFSFLLFIFFDFFKDKKLKIAFFVFSFLSWILVDFLRFSVPNFLAILFIFFLSFLFFLLLGVKNFIFSKGKLILTIFFYFLSFLIFSFILRFFSFSSIIGWIISFLLFFFLLKEFFIFLTGDSFWDRRKKIYLLAVSFLTFQTLWISSLLSLGFLNSASLSLVFLIVALDIIFHYFSGSLNRAILVKNLSFLLLFSLIILFFPYFFFLK